jgi:glycosyltransferase involved in cell wall biosynthesis
MKLIHIATRHRVGGAERNLVNSVVAELERGYEVHVAAGADGFVNSFPDATRVHVMRSLQREPTPIDDVRTFRALCALALRERFDVVHTHQSKAGVLGRLAARGRARAIVHTVHMPSFGSAYVAPASRAFLAAERYCAQFTDRIVTVGEEVREKYLAAGIGSPGQYAVVRSPIEIDRFTALRDASEADRRRWREELRVRDGRRVVITIGALDRRKRQRLILEQSARVLQSMDAMLLVAGEGPELRALERRAAELRLGDRVRFLGFTEDIVPLLGTADALVHAAETEGVSQTLVQAMAAGVPVVATEAEGQREVPDSPVIAVDRGGERLGEALHAALLGAGPPPIDPETFAPWRPESVERSLDAHYQFLEARVGAPPRPAARLAHAGVGGER